MTVRVRAERVEVTCSELPRDLVEKFQAAILDVLRGVKDCKPDLSFRAFAVALGLHSKLEGQQARDYLARFVANRPKKLGPVTGSGAAFYFGVEGERLFSTVTVDISQVVQDAAFIRLYGAWDAARVAPEALAGLVEAFARKALDDLDLQWPV